MAKKRIFIGSASESKKLAQSIAQTLANNNYRPLRWWNEFPPGSITFDRLVEIAQIVDGAVFIFSGIDKTWYRQEATSTPRDNILLEYGMFAMKLGRSRTLILKDVGSKMPTDLQAITYEDIIEDTDTVSERVIKHFNAVFSVSPATQYSGSIKFVADPVVIEQLIGETLPKGWFSRALYVGMDGAKGWLAVTEDELYRPQEATYRITNLILDILSECEVRTFVSFGPGDAAVDREIAVSLRKREPWLQYIPIDINDFLLLSAVDTLSQQVVVPVGILSDFEDRLNFIESQVGIHGNNPILYSLIGGTLGNLDKYERCWFETVRSMMKESDLLLLDVTILGDRWSLRTDRRYNHSYFGPELRRFICAAISHRTAEPVEEIARDFDKRICFEGGLSDVPGTKTIRIFDSKTQTLVTHVRRYQLEDLKEWLESTVGLEVLSHKSMIYEDAVIGHAVILLKKSQPSM